MLGRNGVMVSLAKQNFFNQGSRAAPAKPTAKEQVAADYDRLLARLTGAEDALTQCHRQADQTFDQGLKTFGNRIGNQPEAQPEDGNSWYHLPLNKLVDLHEHYEADRDACESAFMATAAELDEQRAVLDGKVYDGK